MEVDSVFAAEIDRLYEPLSDARELLAHLCSPSATIEDSAEAAIRMYNIARRIPKNLFVSSAGGYMSGNYEPNFSDLEGQEFMGDFDVDQMKLNMEMKASTGPKSTMPLTAEDLKKLADQKINITDVQDAQFLPSTGLSAADLPRGSRSSSFRSPNTSRWIDTSPGTQHSHQGRRGRKTVFL